mgnify:CR=1 FL=1
MSLSRRATTALGIIRSLLIYYAIPGRAGRLRRFYAPFVQPGDVCFDVGAHVGNHTRAMRRLGARVIAVEPQPDLARLLRRWYGNDPAVSVVEAAVGAQAGEQALYVSARHPTVTTLSRDWIDSVGADRSFAGVEWRVAGATPVTTLDALIAQFGEPAYCKIDVEGYEVEALRGLSRPLQAVSFEFIPAALDLALACIERLSQLGEYVYNWTVGEQMRLREPGWLDGEAMAARLRSLPPHHRSGDVVAQRVDG